jgi:hypothetical protein
MDNEQQDELTYPDNLTSMIGEVVTQEQPGGRVVTRFRGAPVDAKSIDEETRDSFAQLCAYYGWLGPLVEAAIYHGVVTGGKGKVSITTPWGSDEMGGVMDDAEKHAAYVDHVKSNIAAHQPWLWPIFETANASLLISPTEVSYCVKTRLGVQFDIPALRPFAALVPFAQPGEAAH